MVDLTDFLETLPDNFAWKVSTLIKNKSMNIFQLPASDVGGEQDASVTRFKFIEGG